MTSDGLLLRAMPKRAKIRKYALADAEKWAVECFVHVNTMRRVLDGGELTGRASARCYRYLESHGLLHLIEGYVPPPEGKPVG